VRVDRPDPADKPGDLGMAGNARRFDEPDARGKDLEREASGVGRPGSPPPLADATLRIEQTLGYCARVEAVYRQYGIDHGHCTAKEPERETVTFVGRRVEAEDWHPHLQTARYEALDTTESSERRAYQVHCRALVETEYEDAHWSRDSGQPALRQPSEGAEGKLLHADADPLRVFGPASETHPEEFQEAMTRLGEAGVEVDLRPGSMSYSPAAVGGRPGRLILDPEASYGAVLHEMSHFSDDELAGFPGLRYWLEDPTVTAGGESSAYQAEIDYANSIGEPGIADQLEELKAQRIGQLIGENDE
jgi:hypothetical protein